MKIPLAEAITILLAVCAAVASFAVNQNDVATLDKRVSAIEGLKLERLDWEMTRTRCDVKTIKALIQQKPEPDC